MAEPTPLDQVVADAEPDLVRLRFIADALPSLKAERLAIWRRLRAQVPPVPQRVIGDASGVSPEAVVNAFRSAEAREAKLAKAGKATVSALRHLG